jgi:hypothetical protein
MTDDNNNALTAKYPKLFTGFQRPNGQGYYPFWFECGDGWYNLIERLASNIQSYVDNQNDSYTYKVQRGEAKEEDRPEYQVRAVQVKEKFGGLRFYVTGGGEYVDGLIAMAEDVSYMTCESCGNPGKPNDGGWIRTLCNPCDELDKQRKAEYNAKYEAERAARLAKEQENG